MMMETRKMDLIPLLDWIDPSSLSYSEWTQVGMALKEEGYSYTDWENWSARDPDRFKEGEAEKKWATFNGNGNPVTGATITQMAKNNGWMPRSNSNDEVMDWTDSFTPNDIDRDYKLINVNYIDGTKIEAPKKWNQVQEIRKYLTTLFDPGDYVGFVIDAIAREAHGKTKWIPADKGVYTYTVGKILEDLDHCDGDISTVFGTPQPEAGAWIRFNPLDGQDVKNENVVSYKYALVESDAISIEMQNEILRRLELPIATLTYSAGKSLHAVVKIDANNKYEYQEQVDYLYKVLEQNGMRVDKQNRNPSRLTRFPGFQRGDKKQFLIATNIGKKDWTEWKEYIEDLNDNLPEMENMGSLFDKPIELAPELISGVLRQGHKMLIAGPSKAGKSFALIQLAIAIAEGWKWFGFQCKQGKVLYVNLEVDERSAKKRFVDIYNALGRGHEHVDNIDVWNLRGKTAPMDKLTPKLIRRAKDNNYQAIIIDPIYKVLTGDENNAHDMSLFVNQFDKIATELGSSVIYAHHHSKGVQGDKTAMDRASGSGVFARDPDAILDMINLPVSDELRGQVLDEALCQIDWQAIKQYNPEYRIDKKLIDPDQTSTELLKAVADLPNAQSILQTTEQIRQVIRKQVHLMTAWRVDGTLREFPKFDPVNCWFRYPIHLIDNQHLKDVKLETTEDRFKKGGQRANVDKKEQSKKELDEAYSTLQSFKPDDPVTVQALSGLLGISESGVYKRVKKHPEYEVIDGIVTKN